MVPSEQDRPDKVSLTLGGRPVTDQNQPAQQANQFPELLSYNNPLKSQLPIETITKPKIEKPINPSRPAPPAPPSIIPPVRSASAVLL